MSEPQLENFDELTIHLSAGQTITLLTQQTSVFKEQLARHKEHILVNGFRATPVINPVELTLRFSEIVAFEVTAVPHVTFCMTPEKL